MISMRSQRSRSRKLFTVLCGGVVLALVIVLLINYRTVISVIVMHFTWTDARRLAADLPRPLLVGPEETVDEVPQSLETLVAAYGDYFRDGYFDREGYIRHLPSGRIAETPVPGWLVILSYVEALERRTDWSWDEDSVKEELKNWFGPVALSSTGKEALVYLLINDPPFGEDVKWIDDHGGFYKRYAVWFLYHVELAPVVSGWVRELSAEHWAQVLLDCRHSRPEVRAGALLLLYHHPSRDRFVRTAKNALKDEAQKVRLAAASMLALDADDSGAVELIQGLAHDRWEIRYWCAITLFRCAANNATYFTRLEEYTETESDSWIKREMIGNLNSKDWSARNEDAAFGRSVEGVESP